MIVYELVNYMRISEEELKIAYSVDTGNNFPEDGNADFAKWVFSKFGKTIIKAEFVTPFEKEEDGLTNQDWRQYAHAVRIYKAKHPDVTVLDALSIVRNYAETHKEQ